MAIEGVNYYTGGTAAASATNRTMGKEDFLRLFTAQLKEQNPLNPLDGADFTAQLATFSSLEQLTNLGKSMDNLLLFQGSLQNTLSVSFIGKHVTTADGKQHLVSRVEFHNGTASVVFDDGTTSPFGNITAISA